MRVMRSRTRRAAPPTSRTQRLGNRATLSTGYHHLVPTVQTQQQATGEPRTHLANPVHTDDLCPIRAEERPRWQARLDQSQRTGAHGAPASEMHARGLPVYLEEPHLAECHEPSGLTVAQEAPIVQCQRGRDAVSPPSSCDAASMAGVATGAPRARAVALREGSIRAIVVANRVAVTGLSR